MFVVRRYDDFLTLNSHLIQDSLTRVLLFVKAPVFLYLSKLMPSALRSMAPLSLTAVSYSI